MPGLGPSLNKKEIILDTWLSQELVFDNEIATQVDAHLIKARSKAVNNYEKAAK